MPYHNKHNVLFLECGSSGQGGSFRSLKEHIEIMRDTLDKIVIVLVNDSVFKQDYLNLGCEVIRLKHPIYSRESKYLNSYNKLFALCRRISSKLTLYFQIIVEKRFSSKLVQLIKKHHIDLIYLNNQPMRNFSGFIAAKKTHVALVSHIRTLHTFGFSGSFYQFIKMVQPKFIAISHAVRTAWKAIGVEAEVIYNPVPIFIMQEYTDKEYDVIYVGRLIAAKGIELLLDVLLELQKKYPLKAILLGDGPLKSTLRSKIDNQCLGDHIQLLGYKSDALQYIQKSKILVFPSWDEGLGRVVIEAMKLKTAVISTDAGGVVELVMDHKNGLVFDKFSKSSLYAAISRLLADEKLRTFLTEEAYIFSMNSFSAKAYYCKVNNFLKK